jgi:hypothetical protein
MAQAAVEIRPVRSSRDLAAFIEAAFVAQGANPLWTPPLNFEFRYFCDPRSPLLSDHAFELLVATRGARPVGRIMAIHNRAHLARHHDATGHFGFIEAIDDPEVFAALTGAAAQWLRERGLARMLGPMSATINHEVGLLVDGFDTPSMVRTNYAPPYYARHLEALGFTKAMDVLAASCRVAESNFPERVRRTLGHTGAARDLRTHGLSLRNWAASIDKLTALYNDAWRDNWNAVAVSQAEGRLIGRLSLPVVKPSWIRMAELHGEPIAVVSQIPNVNEVLRKLGGRLWPLGWARLLWHVHVRGTKTTRIPIIGVASKWRGTKIGSTAVSLLLAEAIERARAASVEEMEISWMLETNKAVLNLVAALPARRTRTFRVYERRL